MSGLLPWVWEVLRAAAVHNFRLKLFALTFSLGLFAYFHGQGDSHQRTVPFDVISRLPPDSAKRALLTALPSAIYVTLKGPVRTLDQLDQSGAPIELDLSGGTRERIIFNESLLSLPRDVSVLAIEPKSVTLDWQSVVERDIPLQASLSGEPAEGFIVKGEPSVTPDKLTAVGPSGKVEVLQFVRLAPFDVSGLTEGIYRRRIALYPPPERVSFRRNQASTGESALVAVTIARRMSEVKFLNRPVSVVGVPIGFASPASVEVTVVGPPEVVRALRPEQVVPRADFGQLPGFNLKENKRGVRALKLTVDLANAEVQIQPPSVTVRW